MTGRTLTQPALPITFGDKVGVWRAGLAEATADLEALAFPVQVGGPVGTDARGRRGPGRPARAGRRALLAHPAPAGHAGGRRARRDH